jgi:hypothetical protein
MSRITLDGSSAGHAGFPEGFRILGHDELGDPIAVDDHGVVWVFAHGAGDWDHKTKAFASEQLLHEHIACQHHFEVPTADLDLDSLKQHKHAIETFLKGRRGAPYSLEAGRAALADLREAIADRRFWSSKRGRGLAACQALGLRCEQALRDAGAPGEWMCRAMAGDGSVLGIVGPFDPPWTEARVLALLEPLAEGRQLRCRPRPRPS